MRKSTIAMHIKCVIFNVGHIGNWKKNLNADDFRELYEIIFMPTVLNDCTK